MRANMSTATKQALMGLVLRTPPLRAAVGYVYRRVGHWSMSRRFGPGFRYFGIGHIDVFGSQFPFYSPDGRFLRHRVVHEPGVCGWLLDYYVNRPICFIDIGAMVGYFSVVASYLCAENVVHAFEPDPAFFPVLQRNFEINRIRGGAHALALSNHASSDAFARAGPDLPGHKPEAGAKTATFDDWCRSNDIRPDLVKVDVHGAEGKVLFGMQRSLREGSFEMVLEMHPQYMLFEYPVKDIVALLFDSGYEMLEMTAFRYSRRSPLVPIDREGRAQLEDPSRWTHDQNRGRRMFLCRKRAPAA